MLMYYAGNMEFKVLQKLFGVPPSTLSRTFTEAGKALAKSLARIPEAKFRWTSFKTQSEWSRLVQRKEQLLENRFYFIDGKNFRVQEPSPADLQNAFTMCWSPERLHLLWMARSFGESITVPVYEMIPKPAEVSKRSSCMNDLHNSITAVRQAAERGMGATSKCFPRLLQPLPYEPEVRARHLTNIFRLYNVRVIMAHISQIRNVFYS
ncbi:hypothetical protein PsorP6_001047 [Peronosclerospora sorghi]|uniref:Uncharacterized protein n=1 Tax=Peronosclerospora sorghi TaxID=230839 RepID=A0ACC0WPQ2_9STRA|nr:hypothetical protein PsorP6_001047 [Peronosclerospora sorghi]